MAFTRCARRCKVGRVQALFVAEGESGPALARDPRRRPQAPTCSRSSTRRAARSTCWRTAACTRAWWPSSATTLRAARRAAADRQARGQAAAARGPRQRAGSAEPGRAGAHRARARRARHRHPQDRAVGVTPTVVKASAGATEHIKIAHRHQPGARARGAEGGRASGSPAPSPRAAKAPWKIDFNGAHRAGARRRGQGHPPAGAARLRSAGARFPMAGQVASLNVGAAGAMLLYEIVRQRMTAPAA